MEEEIIRKVIPRKSCLISRYQQNGHLRSHSQSAVNLHRPLLLKRTSVKPCMTSTPQQFRRKTIDNSEYETLTQRKRRGKACRYSNDLLENITPIKGQEGKHSLGLVQGITSLNGMADTGTNAYGNICGESFDIMADKSPTQNQMLSLDESILETVDLDSAVKDYWDSQNRNLNLDMQGMECENLQSCPEGGDKVINDEIMKSTPQPGAASSHNIRTQCSKKLCDMHSPSNRILYKHMVPSDSQYKDSDVRINSDLNADFQSTDVVWENDSFFEDALSSIEKGIAIPNSPVVSKMPLGEKIKRTLITNVKKPVTPKAKSIQVNDEHIPQNNSSNTSEESAHYFVGSFFGLPTNVKSLIHKFKGITDLYVWQKECLSLVALQQRKNLVYALPTSGGKTLVAEIMILREIVCRRKNAIFILPYVAIVQEKVRSLAPFGLELDFFVEEYAAGKGQYPPPKRRRKQTVYVATIEKAVGLTNSLIEAQRLEELGLFVVDELHLVGDSSGRGSILEGLLTKVMYMQGGHEQGIHL